MRWPIRNQILLPIACIQVVAIGVISIATAVVAARRAESDMLGRMQDVVQTLSGTSFPDSKAVLEKMKGLSGADFAVIDWSNKLKSTTLVDPIPLADLPARRRADEALSLDPSQTMRIGDQTFLMGRVEMRNSARSSLIVFYPEQRWQTIRRDALQTPLMIGGVTLVLMVGVSIWLAARMGRRMRTIQDKVAQVAAGDFQQIDLHSRDDEIRDLAESVNRMSTAMQQMTATIRDNERASLITQLAGGLAHQLRNAITGARMAVQVHRRRCESDQESLEVALSQLKLTEAQVSGLLRMTRDDRRIPVPGEISQLIENVITLVRPMCEHAGVKLEVGELSSGLMVGDADGLQAAVLNLVLNAVHAAGPGGVVSVESRLTDQDAGGVVVDVRDNGPGVSDEVAETLFDAFVTTKPEGVGLGLALAKQAAVDQHGSLSYRRESGCTVFSLAIGTRMLI